MALVHGTCSRNMERSERDLKGKSKRKRRRRCKGKERVNMLSTLIGPIGHWDTGASSAEDADSLSTSSLEVKENEDDKSQVDCDLLRKYHPSTFCATFPKRGPRALKRKQPLADGKDQNHLTCKRAAWAVAHKNALVQLNELRPGLRYEIMSKTGPLHAPVFSVGVEVNGFHFEGRGPTKKQAKMRAAELALRSFIQFPNASQAHASMGNFTSTPADFTADKLDIPDAFLKEFEPSMFENCDLLHCNTAKNEVFYSIYNHRRLVRLTMDFFSTNPKRQALSSSLLGHLSPVALLNELRPGLRYMCLTERVHGRPMRRFVMVVRVEGRVFEGCGHSKRLAKAQAAAAALQSIYNVTLGPERKGMGLHGSRAKHQLPQFFAESIFHLVREKYSELTDGCFSTSSQARHKVLAGIVMTRGFDLRSAQVVSLATGTKCLDSDNVSDHGGTLSDCHAEVVSRRALVRFLYAQLELLLREPADSEEQSIFVPNKGGGGFRLQDGVLFHMYVSSSPCGDARLNCPYETTAAYPSRRFHCHLRVKVDGGEGTLPITAPMANVNRTGVAQGKPPVTMSCTDKMAKWSVVGLQGALLSHLVEPVYLHSLTVGTLNHTGHLGRAMARRLAPVKNLLFPYRRQQLLLGCLNSSEVRPTGKAPNVSMNWSCGDGGLEEISTSTGRRKDSGTPSQLCKRSMFARWQRLQQQFQFNAADTTPGTYSASKMAAGHYQRAMQQFTSALQGGGLGSWLRKPPELGHFNVSV
ncbi:double-stranded RNA-specific editase B2-like [Perca fluviatilis]|uniref:double-stranded RNA-specific editase B2-like n=1 Tax=Perca fluviatilis TaxID=8168 RepID=UPI001963DC7D|nr:double-stranded RNA-specific editase B2-like [Perca fluviatilis]